jgi:hypothetical protein
MAPKRRDFDEVVSTVYKYEAFIEERLKPDLYKALEQRNKACLLHVVGLEHGVSFGNRTSAHAL